MKSERKAQRGCLGAIVFLSSVVIVFSYFRSDPSWQPRTDEISWVKAVEKCKEKYISQRSDGMVKVSNCKKRNEDDDFFYFSWAAPQSIFIKKPDGGQFAFAGVCQVSKNSGEIVYLSLDSVVLVTENQH